MGTHARATREIERLSATLRARTCSRRAASNKGDRVAVMLPESAAVPRRRCLRRPARRPHGREREPALHAARARASARRTPGARAIVDPRELRAHAAGGAREHETLRDRDRHDAGRRPARLPERAARQLRRASTCNGSCRPWQLPDAVRLPRRARRRASAALDDPRSATSDHRVPAVHGRHDRRRRRARC